MLNQSIGLEERSLSYSILIRLVFVFVIYTFSRLTLDSEANFDKNRDLLFSYYLSVSTVGEKIEHTKKQNRQTMRLTKHTFGEGDQNTNGKLISVGSGS